MNIEEERKAFELLCYPNASTVKFEGETYSPNFQSEWQRVVSSHANKLFPVWLAAKTEANKDIEMLLSVCAFETIEQARVYYDKQEPLSICAVTAQQVYDDGFAAGIKHAKEMAKPICSIQETMGDKFGLYDERSNRAFKSFATAEEARVWATSNGYRVIEE